jgi:hypothetical protein
MIDKEMIIGCFTGGSIALSCFAICGKINKENLLFLFFTMIIAFIIMTVINYFVNLQFKETEND